MHSFYLGRYNSLDFTGFIVKLGMIDFVAGIDLFSDGKSQMLKSLLGYVS